MKKLVVAAIAVPAAAVLAIGGYALSGGVAAPASTHAFTFTYAAQSKTLTDGAVVTLAPLTVQGSYADPIAPPPPPPVPPPPPPPPPPVADKIVSPAGSDSTGTGSLANPYATIEKGLENITVNDTVWMRGNAGAFPAQTIDSAGSAGIAGNRKTVKAYTGEQAIVQGKVYLAQTSGHIEFIGNPNVRLGQTADTIRFYNPNNDQHGVETYGTDWVLDGIDVDHGNAQGGNNQGSLIAWGYNGGSGQYRAVDGAIRNCLLRNVGVGLNPAHDHGIYLNYNLNSLIEYNVFNNIQGGGAIQAYSESGSARHIDGSIIRFNTMYKTRNWGIILSGDGNSTTKNTDANHNLVVDAGRVGSPSESVFSYMVYWGGPTGTGNVGTANHSFNPKNGHVQPGLNGWTLATPSTGDPLFVNAAAGDFRLQAGSPAAGIGAFPTPGSSGGSGGGSGGGSAEDAGEHFGLGQIDFTNIGALERTTEGVLSEPVKGRTG